jgi:iron complex transport system substrate-binding protein
MIECAGGRDAMARRGAESMRTEWSDVIAWQPDVVIVAPCGFDVEQATVQARALARLPGWSELPAVRNRRVFAVDANAWFARPGPRIVEGVELLERLFDPGFPDHNGEGFRRI